MLEDSRPGVSHIRTDGLFAVLRKCWVLKHDKRLSGSHAGWSKSHEHPAIVIEHVSVEEQLRRQGRCRRFIEQVTDDRRFELTVVEAVQNKHLAEALLRWGWDCDPRVMDFYHLKPAKVT